MTFDEIVDTVAARHDITRSDGKERIGQNVNIHYHAITGELGMQTSRRGEVEKVVTVGSRYVTFANVEKLYMVYTLDDDRVRELDERPFSELRRTTPQESDDPKKYAVSRSEASEITIFLDAEPATAYTLYADAERTTDNLEGNDEPAFPQSFHDVLILYAQADEFEKSEKTKQAQDKRLEAEVRKAKLFHHVAVTGWLRRQNDPPPRPWSGRR